MLIICGIGRKTPWKLCLRGFLSQRTSTPRNSLRLKYKFHHQKLMICCHKLSLPDCRIRLMTKWSIFSGISWNFGSEYYANWQNFHRTSVIRVFCFWNFRINRVYDLVGFRKYQIQLVRNGYSYPHKRGSQKPERFIPHIAGSSIMGIMYSCLLLTWTKDHWYGQFRHDNRH